MISTKLWIHTAARYPLQCETQCVKGLQPTNEDSAQCFLDVSSPSHPTSEFSMRIRSSYHFLKSSVQYFLPRHESSCHILSSFGYNCQLTSFFTSFFICISAMFGAMASEPEGTCYASTYDSASQQYLELQRSGSNPQHTCRIYPCLNLLEWPLNVGCMNLFLPPFSSLFKVIRRRHDDPSQAEGGGTKQSDTYQDITLQGGQ